jgi:hypothetical protein
MSRPERRVAHIGWLRDQLEYARARPAKGSFRPEQDGPALGPVAIVAAGVGDGVARVTLP